MNKMLQDLPVQQRGDAVSSMVYEADARVRDPVYGCVGAISSLQHQVAHLQTQLAVANAEIVCMRMNHTNATSDGGNSKDMLQGMQHQQQHHRMSPPVQPTSPELQHHYKPGGYHRMENLELGEPLWT